LEDRNTRFEVRKEEGDSHGIFFAGPSNNTMFMTLVCLLMFQAAAQTSSLPFYAILVSVFGLLVSGGAISFFIKYGTRLAMVEKESADNKAGLASHCKENQAAFEKHAQELNTANTQVALVAAALEIIKNTLTELKKDVKDWMKEHSKQSADE